MGVHAGALRVAVSAPPEDGKANEAIIRQLAQTLDLPANSIQLLSGFATRAKRFLVEGLAPEAVAQRLADQSPDLID
jgi:uncharacterized protein YggU (UPF0235/DUF167 family)